jgi:hypothetical protein
VIGTKEYRLVRVSACAVTGVYLLLPIGSLGRDDLLVL